MAIASFSQYFTILSDGSLKVLQAVRIGGVTLQPDFIWGKGVNIGGVDLTNYKGRDLNVVYDNGVNVIVGIF